MKKKQTNVSLSVIGRGVLAASLIMNVFLFVSPEPATAIPPGVVEPTARAAESAATTTTPPTSLSDYIINGGGELDIKNFKVQQKYLDLAGELKEEVKFRAKQGQEKAGDVAKQALEERKALAAERAAERAAKLKEYDDMFDEAEKQRNESFRSKIISRDSYVAQFQEVETREDRSELNRMMQVLGPNASPVEELRYYLERDTKEVDRLKLALVANSMKDQDLDETKVERTLLKIQIKKAEQVTAKQRKSIALQQSLETIKAERAGEVKVYQDRADAREAGLQEKIEQIRLAKERDREEYSQIRARKKQELEDLKFANQQILFERRFDDLDRFETRKGIMASQEKQADKAKMKNLVNELNALGADSNNAQGQASQK